MKANRIVIATLVVLAMSPAMIVTAATKNWIAGSGNWNTGANWTGGTVPMTDDTVRIFFNDGVARTVTYDVSAPALGLLSIDLSGPGTTMNTLSLPSNNTLTATAIRVGGFNGITSSIGRGAVNQSAGTTTISPGFDLSLAWGSGSTGTYTLGGGALAANQSEFIGYSGTGTFNHSGGTNTINASDVGSLILGVNSSASGAYNLSGTGALVSNESEYIGYSGTGIFNQTGGTNTISGVSTVGGFPVPAGLYLGYNPDSFGTYTLSGGTLENNGYVFIGRQALGNTTQRGGTFIQSGGEHFVASDIYIGGDLGGTGKYEQTGGIFHANQDVLIGNGVGELIVDGPTTSFSIGWSISVGDDGAGSLLISDGATVTTGSRGESFGSAYVGRIGSNSTGHVVVRDPGSRWDIPFDLHVGQSTGPASTVDIQNQGLVSVGRQLSISTSAAVNLVGGTLRFGSVSDQPFISKLNYVFGTVQFGGNRTVGGPTGDTTISALYGAVPVIPAGKELTVEQMTTLNTNLTINGGTLTVGQLVNAPLLQFDRGTLNLTNQALTIGSGGLLGSTLDLNDDMTVNVTLGITNQGLVTGDGQIGGTFANAATGELRAQAGRSLRLTGSGNTNAGQIKLLGGELEFTQNLTNSAGAFISGNGSLIVGGGLVNQGTMNFAGTANIDGAVTNAPGGKIISGGGGATIFYDDVTNNGEIRTSTNGFAVFFGSVSGSGTFTGTGTVNFEGDLTPGNSPAAIKFAGDVVFGPEATLRIELGGTAAGSQYDQISVAGELTLDGTLEISLINGFTPSAGQSFDILNWGTLAGAFSDIQLPPLEGFAWNTSQLATGTLSVALPGDIDLDGDVDRYDAAEFALHFGTTGSEWTTGDFDDDDATTLDDLAILQGHFGERLAMASPAIRQPVPEPSTWTLGLVVASACGSGWMRRRCRFGKAGRATATRQRIAAVIAS